MADLRDYDLLDEVNCAASCEAVAALCGLVDKLVKDRAGVHQHKVPAEPASGWRAGRASPYGHLCRPWASVWR